MPKKTIILVVCTAYILKMSVAAESVSGFVLDSELNPVKDARIEIAGNPGVFTASASDGSFSIMSGSGMRKTAGATFETEPRIEITVENGVPYISSRQNIAVDVEIFTLYGRCIAEIEGINLQAGKRRAAGEKFGRFGNGVYILRLSSGGNVWLEKSLVIGNVMKGREGEDNVETVKTEPESVLKISKNGYLSRYYLSENAEDSAVILLESAYVDAAENKDALSVKSNYSAEKVLQLPYQDSPSSGGVITFQDIGAPGWYPSRRDPAGGECDAVNSGTCCMTVYEFMSDSLTPWNEELIMSLRGPIVVESFTVYQPGGGQWKMVSSWERENSLNSSGIAFRGDGTQESGFSGVVGNKCIVNASTDSVFPCGPGSVPYCPASDETKYYGWGGSKLFILLASMPYAGSDKIDVSRHCSTDETDGWWDAPWIGLSHGELIRSGQWGGCHCYSKNPDEWWLADGCGQFNVFEIVNDNNDYQNFDVFSTNLFAYHGYVGEGPCGINCDVSGLAADVDLIDKSDSRAASTGGIATPDGGPGVAFIRPVDGFRYFIICMDVNTRTIQIAVIHPDNIPSQLEALLPTMPADISRGVIDNILALRLPEQVSTGVLRDKR